MPDQPARQRGIMPCARDECAIVCPNNLGPTGKIIIKARQGRGKARPLSCAATADSGAPELKIAEGWVDTALIVFVFGTAASYLPIYWGLNRLKLVRVRQREARRQSTSTSHANREFLDLLRREAAARASAMLRKALLEAQVPARTANGRHAALREETRQSLEEAKDLVGSLFAGNIHKAYAAAVAEVNGARYSTNQIVSATVAAALEGLEGASRPATASAPPADVGGAWASTA